MRFTDRMLSMMCFEFNGNEAAQGHNNVLQRLMKHRYQKVCADYQSVLNQ